MELTSKRRKSRARRDNLSTGNELSKRAFNAILCGIIMYGLIANVLTCAFVPVIPKEKEMAFLITYLIVGIIGVLMSSFSRNPFISFIGYNLLVLPSGVALKTTLIDYAESVGTDVILEAFIITSIIVAVMTLISIVKPEWFNGLGGILFGTLFGLLLARIVLLMFGFNSVITSWIGAILFSIYIGYDVKRSQECYRDLDNAVDSALDIYLDIVNLFLTILDIKGDSDD